MAQKAALQTKSTKLNEVKHVEKMPRKLYREDIDKLFQNVTKEMSMEVLNATVRKAVRSSELQRKYPPLPNHVNKLSEPTKATYIALYNKYRNVLKPQTVGRVKGKIAEYLKQIDEKSMQQKIERDAEMQRRRKRKSKAKKGIKETEFTNFCHQKCDELFETILNKFTEFLKNHSEIPKPLIMAPGSLILYQNIEELLKKLINWENNSIVERTEKIAGTADIVVTITEPEDMVITSEHQLVMRPDRTQEIGEMKDIVDTLAYFITVLIQNSLVEAAETV